MAFSEEDLEGYLARLDRRFERIDDGTFLVSSQGSPTPVALRLSPPVLLARVAIGALPRDDQAPLLRRLLELNATELVHVAFGLEGEQIVLSAALEVDNLDLNELTAVLEDLDLALARNLVPLHDLAQHR